MGLICRNNGNEQIGYVTLLLGGTVVNFYFEGVAVAVCLEGTRLNWFQYREARI